MDVGLIMTSPSCYHDANFAGLYGCKDHQHPHCACRCASSLHYLGAAVGLNDTFVFNIHCKADEDNVSILTFSWFKL
ncbi:hypothetical protein ACHAW6_015086 [Cyclotella cf. meneghiniana]